MHRGFCIPGVLFALCATVLLVITSISLPFINNVDIVRSHFNGQEPTVNAGSNNSNDIRASEVRFGIWAYCVDDSQSDRTCTRGRAYQFVAHNNDNDAQIHSAWTRGLAVHPVAAGVSFLAFLFSLSTHITVTLFASLLSFLAAVITLIAFAIDIALLALTRHEMNNLNIGAETNTGPGFWLTFASLILLLLAGCTVCFGRRRSRTSKYKAADTYPTTTGGGRFGFMNRFRRRGAAY